MKIKQIGDRFSGTIAGPAIAFASGLFVNFARPDWRMIGIVTLIGLGAGLLFDFCRSLGTREGKAFAAAFAVTMALPPLYVAFEFAMRLRWPNGPGQSIVTMALAGFATGLMIDSVRFVVRRRRLRR